MSDSNPESTEDLGKRIGGWMIGLLWLLVLAGGTWLAQGWLDSREAARAPRLTADGQDRQALVLTSDRRGHHELIGRVNGQPIRFLVDTGASGISIPESVAEQIGLTRGRPFEVLTANGTLRVYTTELDSLAIGPFIERDVRAHINPGMQGETALLGMEFLRHYDLQQRNGELTISLP